MLAGATSGAVVGIAVLAVIGSRVLENGVDASLLNSDTLRARAEFVVGRGGFNVLVLIAGAVGGAALGSLGSFVARAAVGSSRNALTSLSVTGALAGATVAFAAGTAGLGAVGSIDGGVITVSVFRAILLALIVGGVVGAVVGGTAERLAHAEVLGLEGEAWPRTPMAFTREALTAVGAPFLAAVVGIALVWAMSFILLDASHTVALIVFGAVAAAVLFGAAIIAANPPVEDDSAK